MTPQAYDFAAAEHALATATATVDKANTELSTLQSRLAEKQQALNMVAQRRVDGGGSNEDAPVVHLLTLDIAGLEPLVVSAQTRHQSAVEALHVATCNRKSANLQSSPFSDRNYLQLKGVQTGIICN